MGVQAEPPISSLNNPLAIIPAIGSGLFRSIHDWGVSTTPQPYANSRARYWPRGKHLMSTVSMGYEADRNGAIS